MHVAVVGAGIIGLTAAVRLRAAGHAVTPVSYTHLTLPTNREV